MRYLYLLQGAAFVGERYVGVAEIPVEIIATRQAGGRPHPSPLVSTAWNA
jgi:hypothetical protein